MVDIPANATTTATFDGREGFWGSYSGALEKAGDRDWVKVILSDTQTYMFFLSFQEAGSATAGNSVLRIYNANGDLVAENDNRDLSSLNSFIEFSPSSTGTYYIEAAEFGDNAAGSYSLAYVITSSQDIFHGLSDGDNVYEAQLDEIVAGGKGNDTLSVGNTGVVFGEQGNDTITGLDIASQAVGDHIFGGLGNDTIFGRGGGDFLFGDAGNDFIFGGDHGDNIYGGPGADTLKGESGNDTFHIKGSEGVGDSIDGGLDNDTIRVDGGGTVTLSNFNALASSIEIWEGNDQGLFGTSASNTFNFSYLKEKDGLAFVDGKGGNDKLTGSKFADVLCGGAGKDTLTGGAESDFFDFNKISESKVGSQRDTIIDFKRGQDRIDLRDIDAKTGVSGNQKFNFIGKDDFSETKGELRYKDLGSKVIVQGDVNGDGKADFEIFVKAGSLSKGDFFL